MRNIFILIASLFSGAFLLNSCSGNQVSEKNTNQTIQDTVSKPEINYLEIGKDLAIKTKSSLAKYLVNAIAEKGSEGAVEFCNSKAISITDSMSVVLNAKIKRVSDQPRNPNNRANEAELEYINKWKTAHALGEQQAPIINEINGKMIGYYPIITNKMCIQCHGVKDKNINIATYKKIKKLYSADEAIGYDENEIRGIFVVEMNKI